MIKTTSQKLVLASAIVFLVAAIGGVSCLLFRPASHRYYFATVDEFRDYAKTKGLHCHSGHAKRPNDLSTGAYFSTRELSYAEIARLSKAFASEWKGVVWCEPADMSPVNVDYIRCGKVRLMGDKELIRELIP